jgi:hypothetical protein
MFDFAFEVRRPGVGDEQPHQQRCGYGEQSVVEEPDRNETKNQMRTPPEPEVLMKYVEGSDRNDKQNAFHAEWSLTLTKRFGRCQEEQGREGLIEQVSERLENRSMRAREQVREPSEQVREPSEQIREPREQVREAREQVSERRENRSGRGARTGQGD